MELGGKDPMIVLRDANLERAANAAVHYSMQNGGQTCISVERVYVEEPVYDEFVGRVTEKMRVLRQGVPGGPAQTDVGAMTSPSQTDLVEEHVNDAVAHGARAVVGGKRGDGPGDFFEPTLLLDVDHSMECMTEETFGPTLPVMKVADVDEAVRLANDSPYGLQASIWTKDTERGEGIARRLESGVVCINDAQLNYVALELPMGGWKDSGVGSRHGAGGIRKYTKQQTLLVTRFAPTNKDIHMLPVRLEAARRSCSAAPSSCSGAAASATSRPRGMDQRLSLVTLGVADLSRAVAFYEALGWRAANDWAEQGVAFFQAGGMVVALWSRDELARDTAVDDPGGWGGVTLAHNVRSPEEADAVLAEAEAAGAAIGGPGRRPSGAATRASSSTPTATPGRSPTTPAGRSPRTGA